MARIYTRKFKKGFEDFFSAKERRIKDAKLAAGYRLNWTEEGLLGEREAEMGGENMGRNISLRKLNLLLVFLVLAIFFLFARSAYLQTANTERYQQLAQYNRIRTQRLDAERGIIYDSNKKALVYNKPIFYLQVIPADIYNSDYSITEVTNIIRETLGQEAEEKLDYILIKNKKDPLLSYQPQKVFEDIEYETALNLKLIFEDLPGLSVEVLAQRNYLLPSLSFSHILGYTGMITEKEYDVLKEDYALTDHLGKVGLEKFWEKELRGEHGGKFIEVDALGKEKRVINQKNKQDGYNLVLSIDSELQKKLEEEIKTQLKLTGTKKASGVILNPNNGEVLALVSFPSFDNNNFSQGISTENYQALIENKNRPLFSRAVSGEFPTGSTFKPIVAAAALQENIITKNTTINSTGGIAVKSWFFPDWKSGGHGITNVRSALAWSVNTFFYYIGGGLPKPGTDFTEFTDALGVKKITDYARLFGLGKPLGIDLPSEASGFLPSKDWKLEVKNERWYIGDTYHLAIGQGDITATPLQVAAYTSVFANSGTLYKPHLVKELLNSDDSLAKKIEPEVLRYDFIEPEHIETVRQGMRDTIEYGSASSLQSVPVSVAGKTGTAQWSSTKNHHSWFIGFAPFDKPEITITVLVEEGSDGVTSASVPIAKRVLQWYFSQ